MIGVGEMLTQYGVVDHIQRISAWKTAGIMKHTQCGSSPLKRQRTILPHSENAKVSKKSRIDSETTGSRIHARNILTFLDVFQR